MEVYAPTYMLQRSPDFPEFMQSCGAKCTTDPEARVAGAFHLHDTALSSVSLHPEVVREHAGFEPAYVRSRNALWALDLTRKDVLSETLTECGLLTHATQYPRSEADLQAFFAANRGGVYCKPVIGEGAMKPLIPGQASGLLLPANLAPFYRRFDSFAQFSAEVDVRNFLQVQNSDQSLATHKCLVQECYPDTVQGFFISGAVGNPGTEPFFRTASVRPVTSRATGAGVSMTPAQMRSAAGFANLSRIRNMDGYDVDQYGLHAAIKTLFAQAGVANTYFAVQGMLDAQGRVVIDDIDFRTRIHHYRGVLPESAQNEMRFVLGLEDRVTVIDPQYWLYLDLIVPSGLTASMMQTAKDLSIHNTFPMRVGWRRASFIARAGSPEEVQRNVTKFLTMYQFA